MNEDLKKALMILDKLNKTGFANIKVKPETGTALRPKQVEGLRKMLFASLEHGMEYLVLSAPTGSGKSAIAATYAKIMFELNGFKTNLTTSSRVLQKQYGNDFISDPQFKVIMGAGNYTCSLFYNKDEKRRFLASESWCQKEDLEAVDYWGSIEKADRNDISTMHKDQDDYVFNSIDKAIKTGGLNLKKTLTYYDTETKEERTVTRNTFMGEMKKIACKPSGACGYYLARYEADKAAVAIRSIQQQLFYIMYNVMDDGQIPILQNRPIHIHDEAHGIEGVFRDFFSIDFTDHTYFYYVDAVMEPERDETGKKKKKRKKKAETFESKGWKLYPKSNKWTTEEIHHVCDKLETHLSSVIEAVFLPSINSKRLNKERITSARHLLMEISKGNLLINIESLSKERKALLKWFKNLHNANNDHRRAKEAASSGYRYSKRYCADIQPIKDTNASKLRVYPVTLENMCGGYFGTHQNIFMSATPLEKSIFEGMFGLKGKVAYIEIESDFPTENSPIFFDGVVTNTNETAIELGMQELPSDTKEYEKTSVARQIGNRRIHEILYLKILDIVRRFPGVSGIVPCTSYESVKTFSDLFKEEGNKFIFAVDGVSNIEKVNEFKVRSSKGESVYLFSAGITEGHSFDDAISRIQILTKMPYPISDKMMNDLCAEWGYKYSIGRTAMALQQMHGRSMRNKNDYCLTILLDKKFEDLKNDRIKKFYSQHFLKCLNWTGRWQDYKFPKDS